MSDTYSLVGIRLFNDETQTQDWQNVPVSDYMPLMIPSAASIENINKRIILSYFKRPSALKAVRWHFKGNEDEGHWVRQPENKETGATA